MADDIRSRAGLPPGEEAARRRAAGEASRAAAREALTQEQMRERAAREMEARRARPSAPAMEPGPGRIPPPPRPSTVSEMRSDITRAPSSGATPRVSRLGAGLAGVALMAPGALSEMADVGRRRLDARGEAARQRRELNLRSMNARTADAEGSDIAADAERQRQEANRPAPTPASRPAPTRRPGAPAAREISADRLNDLMMGAEPSGPEERTAVMRMRGRQRELEERGTAFRKGGYVTPKAAPKKMKTGGTVTKPKATAAAKAKAKPMPFKKGGVIKKGRK